MAFDCNKFTKVMDTAGLTKHELAALYGVSRQTLYLWRTRVPGQKTLAERAEKYTEGLHSALTRGLLPLSPSVPRERRVEMLRSMAKRLHTLTAPQ